MKYQQSIQSLRTEIKNISYFSIFFTLMSILAFTQLGMITFGPVSILLAHIPLLMGYCFLPHIWADVLGIFFGLFRLIRNTYLILPLSSFWFSPFAPVIGQDRGSWWALLINFLPLIIIALLARIWPYLLTQGEHQNRRRQKLAIATWGMIGSLINTVIVLGLVYFLFTDVLEDSLPSNTSLAKIFLGIVFSNGLLEALFSFLALGAISPLINKYRLR